MVINFKINIIKMKNKIFYVILLFLLVTHQGNAQNLNGVFEGHLGSSKIRLFLYEENFSLFAVHQYFKKSKNKKPTEQVVMQGWFNPATDMIYLRKIEKELSYLNNMQLYYTTGFDGIVSEFPNKITCSGINSVLCNTFKGVEFVKEESTSQEWQNYKMEFISKKYRLLYKTDFEHTRSIKGFKFKLVEGEEWLSYQGYDSLKVVVNPKNMISDNVLRVFLKVEHKNNSNIQNYVHKWLFNTQYLWSFSYPMVEKIEFYNYDGDYNFKPEMQILNAKRKIGDKFFIVSLL
jgi:hypothetical protein